MLFRSETQFTNQAFSFIRFIIRSAWLADLIDNGGSPPFC